MDIDIPTNTFTFGQPPLTPSEVLFTPGGKRKRTGDEEDHIIDEGSTAKQLRTQQSRPAPLAAFTSNYSSQNLNQSLFGTGTPGTGQQSTGGSVDVFGSHVPLQGEDVEMNPASSVGDYFSREIAPLHSQSSRRLSNLSTSSHPHANYITTMSLPPTPGSFQSQSPFQIPGQEPQLSPFAAQPFSTDLCPPRVGLIQPGGTGGTSQGGTPMEEYTGVAGEVEKARNVHGPQCRTIPKLMLSDHPDPATGKRSMWTMCSDCGSIDLAG